MKRIKKENLLLLISLLIIIIIAANSIMSYTKWYNNYKKVTEATIKECKGNTIEERKEFCKNLLENTPDLKPDYIYTFNAISQENTISIYFIFLLITIPSLYYICRTFKTRNIIYQLSRENYKEFNKNTFKKVYKSSLILPSLFLIIMVFSLIYCNGFTTNELFSQDLLESELNNMISPFIYSLAIILKSFILSIIYINISLIVARKNHNFYISIILSYLLYIGIEIFLEGLIGKILFLHILNIDSMMLYFNIMNIFSLNLVKGYLYNFIPLLLILLITVLIVMKLYKDKEKLILDCEKNN